MTNTHTRIYDMFLVTFRNRCTSKLCKAHMLLPCEWSENFKHYRPKGFDAHDVAKGKAAFLFDILFDDISIKSIYIVK